MYRCMAVQDLVAFEDIARDAAVSVVGADVSTNADPIGSSETIDYLRRYCLISSRSLLKFRYAAASDIVHTYMLT